MILDRIDVDVRVPHSPTSLSCDIHKVSFEQFPVPARYSCKNNVHTQRFGVRSGISYKMLINNKHSHVLPMIAMIYRKQVHVKIHADSVKYNQFT